MRKVLLREQMEVLFIATSTKLWTKVKTKTLLLHSLVTLMSFRGQIPSSVPYASSSIICCRIFLCLVVLGMSRISQVKDDRRVRTRASAVLGKDALKVNRAIEAQRAVRVNVDPVALVVSGRVEHRNVARLHKVARHQQVFLVRRDLNVVWADDGLLFIWVVESLDVVEVRNVEGRNVVAQRQGEVGQLAVVGDVRVDGNAVFCLGTEVDEQLGHALSAVCVLAERVDDPDLSRVHGGRECSGLGVARDELDVLDSAAVGNRDGRDDFATAELPEAQRVCAHDAGGWLQDG